MDVFRTKTFMYCSVYPFTISDGAFKVKDSLPASTSCKHLFDTVCIFSTFTVMTF